ncbi:sigma factor-like helix-turn-helix DNA-binding protein [Streptomyces sp. NPDC059639]|uniref:sigma factor-like helix-turn-helix DNA-binding protein n=1 Tax=Streptomyces sp. NPDC059639 TaxID=3346891 RepID=UPI0036A16D81
MAEADDREELRLATVLSALEGLAPLERAILVLRDAFACHPPQIAAAVGCSEEAVRRLAAAMPEFDDGRGAPSARIWRIAGAENVARALVATVPPLVEIGITLEPRPVGGRPGVILRDRGGEIRGFLVFDITGGRIRTVRVLPGFDGDDSAELGPEWVQ